MAEKMNWSEAEAVVRAYRAEQGATADVDVSTLAQALGTDVAEIRRLAGRKPRFVDRSGVLSAGIALGILALGALAFGPRLLVRGSDRMATVVAPTTSDDPRVLIFENGDRAPRFLSRNFGELEVNVWTLPDESRTRL